MKKSADLFAYLLLIILSMGMPYADLPLRFHILTAFLAIPPTIYLYIKNYTLFVPALFFAILAFLNPLVLFCIEAWHIRIPQVQLLPAMVVYLVILSSISLTIWAIWIGGDLSRYTAHYAADLTISLLLFFMIILPERMWI